MGGSFHQRERIPDSQRANQATGIAGDRKIEHEPQNSQHYQFVMNPSLGIDGIRYALQGLFGGGLVAGTVPDAMQEGRLSFASGDRLITTVESPRRQNPIDHWRIYP